MAVANTHLEGSKIPQTRIPIKVKTTSTLKGSGKGGKKGSKGKWGKDLSVIQRFQEMIIPDIRPMLMSARRRRMRILGSSEVNEMKL